METQCEHTHDAAAYVLGELRGFAKTDFIRHMRTCPICTEEVELLETASHAVPLLATRPAPKEQLPVRDDSNAAFLTVTEAEPKPRQRPTLKAIVGGAASGVSAVTLTRADPTRARPRRKNKIPTPVTIAVAALLVVAVLTVVLTRESNSIHYLSARAGWSGGGAVVKIQGTRAELLVEDMPAPPAGNRYEIWAISKTSPTPQPTGRYLHLNKAGEAGEGLPLDIDNYIALAVYEEPIHGTKTTRSGAVVVADLRSVTSTAGS